MLLRNNFNTIPILRSLMRRWEFYNFKKTWQSLNRHNRTVAGTLFNAKNVSVGKSSYGVLNILSFDNTDNERLIIGNYVSIAPDVTFLLGGEHFTNTLTNYPVYQEYISQTPPKDYLSKSKGPIIIQDEVWIGANALILSGVTVNKGAVIAAGSVVTKDVPAFAIVGGNPAKIIRYRFSEEIIRELLSFNLIDIKRDIIINNIDLFYKQIETKEDVEALKATLLEKNKI